MKKNKYERDLILQIDETSCLVHCHQQLKRVVSTRVGFIPLLQKQPIVHLTCVFAVNSMGGNLQSQILLPPAYCVPPLWLHRFPEVQLLQTSSGWMDNGGWASFFQRIIFPEVERVRGVLGDPSKWALIIVDGHSSWLNRGLWTEWSRKNIDVLLLPAHTSHILQTPSSRSKLRVQT
jgi:hypothetical protein